VFHVERHVDSLGLEARRGSRRGALGEPCGARTLALGGAGRPRRLREWPARGAPAATRYPRAARTRAAHRAGAMRRCLELLCSRPVRAPPARRRTSAHAPRGPEATAGGLRQSRPGHPLRRRSAAAGRTGRSVFHVEHVSRGTARGHRGATTRARVRRRSGSHGFHLTRRRARSELRASPRPAAAVEAPRPRHLAAGATYAGRRPGSTWNTIRHPGGG